jgi:hypothetical protein
MFVQGNSAEVALIHWAYTVSYCASRMSFMACVWVSADNQHDISIVTGIVVILRPV